jgi:hypothetical protein
VNAKHYLSVDLKEAEVQRESRKSLKGEKRRFSIYQ